MLMQSPFASQLASTSDMAKVLPRASEDTQWTWNCIDMDGFVACYGILNTPKIPNDMLLCPSPFAPQLAAAQDTQRT
jgi:hypothetical protein